MNSAASFFNCPLYLFSICQPLYLIVDLRILLDMNIVLRFILRLPDLIIHSVEIICLYCEEFVERFVLQIAKIVLDLFRSQALCHSDKGSVVVPLVDLFIDVLPVHITVRAVPVELRV